MAETARIAVVGDWESVMGFRALGLDTYPVTSAEEAGEAVQKLAREHCGIIYLTEGLAQDLGNVPVHDRDAVFPAIILIPGREGPRGIGRAYLQDAMKRAVGADIL